MKIETGRYAVPALIPVEERLCDLCGVIEDEEHFLMQCPPFCVIKILLLLLFQHNPLMPIIPKIMLA